MPDPVARLNAALSGRYVIERQLGEGGMATVYLAQDHRPGNSKARQDAGHTLPLATGLRITC